MTACIIRLDHLTLSIPVVIFLQILYYNFLFLSTWLTCIQGLGVVASLFARGRKKSIQSVYLGKVLLFQRMCIC